MLDDLRMECVLMQAWKKTASHLRYHSWYSDTLGIDYQALRIPRFLAEIQERLSRPDDWKAQPLELVPAPKSQRWVIKDNRWEPASGTKVAKKLRPLAHVALEDQVVATAIMMCLADRVETALGDPKNTLKDEERRKTTLAYGHRLFCDSDDSGLRHRWGSSKLYRQYFQDYQAFLERPGVVAASLDGGSVDTEIAIVRSDLSKFYDRVRPQQLHRKLRAFKRKDEEEPFFGLAERVFNWTWVQEKKAADYAKLHNIDGYQSIALPQGLVVAGFFANVAMCEFDKALRASIGTNLELGAEGQFTLEDACYYVDDFRLVLRVPRGAAESELKHLMTLWLQSMLDHTAHGLSIEESKTEVTIEGRDQRFLVPQSKTARRIQSEASGTFDMLHGTELIGAIEGFFHTQKRYSSSSEPMEAGRTGLLVGLSDMRDETAARFAAGRFRRTFRSLRPLLAFSDEDNGAHGDAEDDDWDVATTLPDHLVLSKQQLDERARLFAALLIEEWTSNPANVRLLRIAFDMYPDPEFLEKVLEILRPGWQSSGSRGPRREVKVYCLAELFRAGATETALVSDEDCLPDDVSPEEYHEKLVTEALAILQDYLEGPRSGSRHPWYLLQQLMLYLAARDAFPANITSLRATGGTLLAHYRRFAKFLAGEIPTSLEERSIFLCIAYSGFGNEDINRLTIGKKLSEDFLVRMNEVSPALAAHLWNARKRGAHKNLVVAAQRLGIELREQESTRTTVADLASRPVNPFYLEESLLKLASWLFELDESEFESPVTPWQIYCSVQDSESSIFGKVDPDSFELSRAYKTASHLFVSPDWCDSNEERRRFQIGLLLRFAVRGTTGFDGNHYSVLPRRRLTYTRPVSHWEQQRYSSFQGRSAFGPAWIPLSSFTEELLFQLLRWPGAGISTPPKPLGQIRHEIGRRREVLQENRGSQTSEVFMEQTARLPRPPLPGKWNRPLRIGIVQSITPDQEDYLRFQTDPELLGDHNFKIQRRAHLSALMEGVAQMLRVRQTHRNRKREDGAVLDLLIFPELSIHPDDIQHLVMPFVRKHKCMFLCGLVYHKEPLLPNSPLINSCLWLIPEWTKAAGFQVQRIEQGKKYLTRQELALSPKPTAFRPAQWLIEYEWADSGQQTNPLRLSASVCYDATDLGLAADLRSRNDLYIVCALNQDVGTFDRMSEGLHYHMFQGVIVVNNGQFGGSSFFMPYKEQFRRQVFHLHGQPQASIAFAEIDPRKLLGRPKSATDIDPEGEWKIPPADWCTRVQESDEIQ